MSTSTVLRYSSLAIAAAGIVSMGLVLHTIHGKETTVPPPPVPPPAKTSAKGVAATGILEALSENVSIGTPVSGLVVKIPENIKVNAIVKKADVLFLLDDRELRAQLMRQQAAVAVAPVATPSSTMMATRPASSMGLGAKRSVRRRSSIRSRSSTTASCSGVTPRIASGFTTRTPSAIAPIAYSS